MIRTRIAGGAVVTALVAGMLGIGGSAPSASGQVSSSTTTGSSSTAAAAYPRSVRTRCVARLVNKKGHRVGRHHVYRPHRKVRVRFVIRYNATGKMKTRVNVRKQRGKRPAHVIRGHRRYRGHAVTWRFGTGPRVGRYKLKFHTKDGPKSRFRNSSCTVKFVVKRPHRRHHHHHHNTNPDGGVS